MKILLIEDQTIKLDLKKSVGILNRLCKANTFKTQTQPVETGSPISYSNFDTESSQLTKLRLINKVDHVFYCTTRKYENNYYFYSNNAVTILSFYGWKHCTDLPIENGLFYFIAVTQALTIDDTFRHEDTTGCIYDFMWDKTAVDLGMKTGRFCNSCLAIIKKKVEGSSSLLATLKDIESILKILANLSKWGNSILEYEKQVIRSPDWASFENDVAQIYRTMGAQVRQNVNLAGFQIDIIVEENTPSKQKLISAIECKYSKNKVGNRIVNDVVRIVQTLKEAHLVDKGIIVSQSGFT